MVVKRYIITLIAFGLLVILGLWFINDQQDIAIKNISLIHRDLDYGEIGFNLMAKETLGHLKINLEDSLVIKYLGKPEEKSEPLVWGADGLEHQTWNYPNKGIRLDMVRGKKNQTINSITIQHPCKDKTARGVGLGSTKSEVISKYRNEIDARENDLDSDQLVAGTVYGGIIFGFTDGKVSQIFIGAGAE